MLLYLFFTNIVLQNIYLAQLDYSCCSPPSWVSTWVSAATSSPSTLSPLSPLNPLLLQVNISLHYFVFSYPLPPRPLPLPPKPPLPPLLWPLLSSPSNIPFNKRSLFFLFTFSFFSTEVVLLDLLESDGEDFFVDTELVSKVLDTFSLDIVIIMMPENPLELDASAIPYQLKTSSTKFLERRDLKSNQAWRLGTLVSLCSFWAKSWKIRLSWGRGWWCLLSWWR